MSRPSWHWSLVALLALGCKGGGDPLSEMEHISGWANASSALGVFIWGHDPLAITDGAFVPVDSTCPVVADDGTTVTITGDGCTDSEGTQWHGSATVVRGFNGGRSLTLTGFDKAEDPSLSAPVSGSFEVVELATDRHAFDVDISVTTGIENHTVYRGEVQGGWTGRTVWSGTGTIHREALVINSGTVDATTVDQVRDSDICPGQCASGTTTMVSDEHEVVISYDGETACDEDEGARWSRDGQDMGVVNGVTCNVFGGGGAGDAAPGLLLVILALALGTRRRPA